MQAPVPAGSLQRQAAIIWRLGTSQPHPGVGRRLCDLLSLLARSVGARLGVPCSRRLVGGAHVGALGCFKGLLLRGVGGWGRVGVGWCAGAWCLQAYSSCS